MIRYRRPKQDDPTIHHLINTELVPLSSVTTAEIIEIKKNIPKRLTHGVTLVASTNYDDDPLGFVHFMLHGDLLYIDMLAVAPAAQRKCWGNLLMAHAERFAQSRGCKRSKVMVDIINTNGLSFYKKLGYAVSKLHTSPQYYELEKRL
ncbi:GNAT family N-acetyltransferase [Paenibacillus crassostreae]|uniref:GCN5 family acetyltransferase n=1 Tax=Paenibacillus crassostreae TaxID=1763538 RepID=A0A167GU77_9BACL|nr:GNAT family N-acetyltransferase [Paenibacillus crassostreae]AOZ92101.1 GNAT family N-acetyltransferase [Paenibacillus crassostreae]OAB77910.1 GCN5 family acetyltransferase [Paenibacillus crassostreae]